MTMLVGFANFMLISPQNQSGTTTFHLPNKDDILSVNIWTSYSGHFVYSERNAVRMAPYHRLDLTATHKFSWFGRPFTLGLNIYNVYARNNPYLYYIQYYGPPPTRTGPPPEPAKMRILQYSFFTIIPSVSISFTF